MLINLYHSHHEIHIQNYISREDEHSSRPSPSLVFVYSKQQLTMVSGTTQRWWMMVMEYRHFSQRNLSFGWRGRMRENNSKDEGRKKIVERTLDHDEEEDVREERMDHKQTIWLRDTSFSTWPLHIKNESPIHRLMLYHKKSVIFYHSQSKDSALHLSFFLSFFRGCSITTLTMRGMILIQDVSLSKKERLEHFLLFKGRVAVSSYLWSLSSSGSVRVIGGRCYSRGEGWRSRKRCQLTCQEAIEMSDAESIRIMDIPVDGIWATSSLDGIVVKEEKTSDEEEDEWDVCEGLRVSWLKLVGDDPEEDDVRFGERWLLFWWFK